MKDLEGSNASRYGMNWNKEESILAFDLYCRIPFKQTKANNPEVKKLATLLNRTPASVARKLGNFGAFDPELRSKSISGLTHTSKLDQEVWAEFNNDWNSLVWQASIIRNQLNSNSTEKDDLESPSGPSEKTRMMKYRVHQAFFRDAILSSFSGRCCVTRLDIKECLVASHIIPWSIDERFRTDPTNGLCLSATFDRLFDSGLMTLTDDYNIIFSQKVRESPESNTRDHLLRFHQNAIIKPYRFLPSREFLGWHRDNRFLQ